MHGEDDRGHEEVFQAWVIAYHDALHTAAEGAVTPMPPAPELLPRAEQTRACLDLLERVWPRSARTTLWAGQPSSPGQPADPAGERVERVGRFEVLEELGRGGFGVVFRARDPQLGREVALKVPLVPTLAHPDLRRRFVWEAETAAGLSHPNIVPVYEAGEDGGVLYIASEYCPGTTLARWLATQPRPAPPREVAQLIATLAAAAHYFHSRGILHRDLKPANVLLARSEAPGESGDTATPIGLEQFVPRLTDFGLAKVLRREGEETQSGVAVGTLSYMAPEQVCGQVREVGQHTDVYALGVILYEMLVARPPFRGETEQQTREEILSREPVPPSRLARGVPRDLETVCLKCLCKEPERRYPSARELADDLARYLHGEPVQARPVGRAERAWRWCRRNPAVAGLLGLVVLLVVGLSVGTVFLALAYRDADRQRDRAVGQTKKARTRFALAREAVDRLQTAVSQSRELKARGAEGLRKKLLENAAEFYDRFAREEDADPEVRVEQGMISGRLGDVYRELGRDDEAEKAYERARDLFASLGDADPGATAPLQGLAGAYHQLGRLYRDNNRWGDAGGAFRESLRLANRLTEEHPEYLSNPRHQFGQATLQENLGALYANTRRWDEAEKAHREALRIRQGLVDAHPGEAEYESHLASSQNNLGNLLRETGRLDDADRLLGEGLARRERLAKAHPDDPDMQYDLAKSHESVGVLARARGDGDRAAKAHTTALPILKRLAEEHPEVVVYQGSLGGCLCNVGNLAAGARQYEIAVTRFYDPAIKVLDPVAQKAPHDVQARGFLRNALAGRATCYRRLSRYAEAIRDWDRALELDDGEMRDRFRVARAITRAQSGDHVHATAEAEDFATAAPPVGKTFVDAAVIYSYARAALPGDDTRTAPERQRLAGEYAARAMNWLGKARTAGHFENRQAVEYLRQGPDWEGLRTSPAFRSLLGELAGR